MRHLALLLLPLALLASAASAQDAAGNALNTRLDRLERDLNFVQKQVYRSSESGDGKTDGTPLNSGQLQVRFSQIDEELRQIRGLIEQTQFQNRQSTAALKKLSDDVDFRLRALEQKQAQTEAVAAPATATSAAEEAAPVAANEAAKPVVTAVAGATAPAEAEKPASYKPEVKEKPAPTGKDFPDANAHYSHAFKLLSEKNFSEAASSFDAFVKKYPADPLTANAYYWLGESHYARSDFTRATESFRKGFEASPDGQKAPDNLYKLALSLAQIKRKTEACVVLAQVISRYGETAKRTAAKATEARTTMQCK
ncbi:MAG: tol-pal system protein YbgF [Alphaproteobacteria bacterium]|nr:tol-pal system protein YbgF [Alphaproteobacteria bacterium]